MSEWKWIDRKEREPESGECVVVSPTGCEVYPVTVIAPLSSVRSHWMPIPPIPPKMVTIEISEEDAREFAGHRNRLGVHKPSARLYEACHKALEGK